MSQEKQLLQEINNEMHDFTRRNLALVASPSPGMPLILSNGETMMRPCILEAYETVIDLSGQLRFRPGAHVLAWSASQLYDALKASMQAHALEEQLF